MLHSRSIRLDLQPDKLRHFQGCCAQVHAYPGLEAGRDSLLIRSLREKSGKGFVVSRPAERAPVDSARGRLRDAGRAVPAVIQKGGRKTCRKARFSWSNGPF